MVELMVAMVVASIVMTVMFTIFRTSTDSWNTQEEVTNMQQNLRVAMAWVSRDIRMAGCGMNLFSDMVEHIEVYDGATAGGWVLLRPITITNSDAGPDSIDIMYGDINSGEYDATIREGMPDASSELKVDSTDEFEVDDFVVVSNGLNAALFVVSAVQPASLKLQHNPAQSPFNPPAAFKNFPNGGGYEHGSRLYNFKNFRWLTYYIDQTDPEHPMLMVDDHKGGGAQVVAEDIEDMQFYYFMKDGTETNDPTGNEEDIRAVRVSFVARTSKQDKNARTAFSPMSLEDHVVAATFDGYRRAPLQSVIQLRNPRNL